MLGKNPSVPLGFIRFIPRDPTCPQTGIGPRVRHGSPRRDIGRLLGGAPGGTWCRAGPGGASGAHGRPPASWTSCTRDEVCCRRVAARPRTGPPPLSQTTSRPLRRTTGRAGLPGLDGVPARRRRERHAPRSAGACNGRPRPQPGPAPPLPPRRSLYAPPPGLETWRVPEGRAGYLVQYPGVLYVVLVRMLFFAVTSTINTKFYREILLH